MAKVVVVGAGTTGMAAARQLGRKIGGQHDVILVEQYPQLVFQPGLLWVMIGRRRVKQITKQINRLILPGVKIVSSQAIDIDTDQKTVRLLNGDRLSYDFLVLAGGTDATQAETESLALAGHNLYSVEGVHGINRAINSLKFGRVVIVAPAWPFKCSCSIYEAGFLLDEWFRKKGVRQGVEIDIFTPEENPMQMQGHKVSSYIGKKMRQHGIVVHNGQKFMQVDPARQTIHFDSGPVPYDLLIYVPSDRAPYAMAQTGLVNDSGWIPVDPWTLETRLENVYAIGDVNRVPLSSGFDLPKLGVVGHLQAMVVAGNIQNLIEDKPPEQLFSGNVMGFVEIGSSAFAMVGNFYQPRQQFKILPESRFWLLGKLFVERLWLREHN